MVILIVGQNCEQSRNAIKRQFPVIIDNPTDGLRISDIQGTRDYLSDMLENISDDQNDSPLVVWSNDEWIIDSCYRHGILKMYDVDDGTLKSINVEATCQDNISLYEMLCREWQVVE